MFLYSCTVTRHFNKKASVTVAIAQKHLTSLNKMKQSLSNKNLLKK